MKQLFAIVLLASCSCFAFAGKISADISGVKSGPISVTVSADVLEVSWADKESRHWKATFSLDAKKPLISAIAVNGNSVVESANPVYRISTGKRRGGWDAFFDFPPANPVGTQRFLQEFNPSTVAAITVGNRLDVTFDGLKLGIFHGSLRYTFYPASSLIQQIALLSTEEQDVAYFYDAGLQMTAPQDLRAGGNMGSAISYYDTEGKLTEIAPPYGSERHTLQVHYRAVAAKMGVGSIAAFSPPHRYFFARDYTTNQGYLWYTAWRGQVGLGIQQYTDDNTGIDPWMNAPPNTVQEMGLFLLPGADQAADTLKHVLAYTHNDHFEHLDGFVTFAPHWHLAYTVQAMEKGTQWVPPFKPVMEAAGIDAAMIMDFHLDGHPSDLTDVRLNELDEYYKVCRAQSDNKFLLIPSEEANVILGGHWGLVFPKPVYWIQDRKPGEPLISKSEKYGTVYRVHTPDDVWKMVKDEGGYVYQTHPRTKGSTGYPDKILATSYFRDSSYLGTGWKAMPSDLSSPRLGERAFKTLDDINNLGLHKRMIGEIDVFQISSKDELYGHLNINYLRLPAIPDFDHYIDIFHSIQKGDGFITTGEVLLPTFSLTPNGSDSISVDANVTSTFPLRMAEIVWGDGTSIHRETIDLDTTPEFDKHHYTWAAATPGWTWARLAVWDVAGDGAFTNPVWRNAR